MAEPKPRGPIHLSRRNFGRALLGLVPAALLTACAAPQAPQAPSKAPVAPGTIVQGADGGYQTQDGRTIFEDRVEYPDKIIYGDGRVFNKKTGKFTSGQAPAAAEPTKAAPAKQEPKAQPTRIIDSSECGCPTTKPAHTVDVLNGDDNQPLTINGGEHGVWLDIEDTRKNPTIDQSGKGIHQFYAFYVEPNTQITLPPYANPAGRRRAWGFAKGTTPGGAVCEVAREAIKYAQEKQGTGTTVWLFDQLLLNNGQLVTDQLASRPAHTVDVLNGDDNQPLTINGGEHGVWLDIEDTRKNPTIDQSGKGIHQFYAFYVEPNTQITLPPYANPAGRRRAWGFAKGTTPGGAVCEVAREAIKYAQEKQGTGTTVWLFDTPLLINGKLQK